MKYISELDADKLGKYSGVSYRSQYGSAEKNNILNYLRSFKPCLFTTAPVEDPFTGEWVKKTDFGYSDGVYTWYESEIYCLEKYDFALTEEFRAYVREKAGK